MIPTIQEVLKTPHTRRKEEPINIEHILNPYTIEGISLDIFTPQIAERIKTLERKDYFLFGAFRGAAITGIKDDVYKMKMEVQCFKDENNTELRPKTVIVSTYNIDNTYTDLLISIPVTEYEKRVLDHIKFEDGKQKCGESLIDRAQKIDDAIKKEENPHMLMFFDPEEVKLIYNLDNVYRNLASNTSTANAYFRQMVSLIVSGSFADDIGLKMVTGIRGLKDREYTPLHRHVNPDYEKPMLSTIVLENTEERTNAVKELIGNENLWYKNPQFKREINIAMITKEFDNIGRSSHSAFSNGSATTSIAPAVEKITSELYECVTGKESEGSSNFVQKLECISQVLGGKEIMQSYLDVYMSTEFKSMSKMRNGGSHGGSKSTKDLQSHRDIWSMMFYRDLTKFMISLVEGSPKAYYDFDMWARNNNIVNVTKDTCAYIPIAKHYAHK